MMKKIKELAEEWGPVTITVAVLTAVTYISQRIAAILGYKLGTILRNLLKKK